MMYTRAAASFKPTYYQIKIQGKINDSWSDWWDGLKIATQQKGEASQTTTLVVNVADQAALRGILCKLWDQNLVILSVACVDMKAEPKEGENE